MERRTISRGKSSEGFFGNITADTGRRNRVVIATDKNSGKTPKINRGDKNYCEYQDVNSQSNRQLTGNQQATNRQLTAIEESKKVRREEIKKRVSKDTPKETPEDIISQYDFSEAMVIKIREWLKYKSERRETYKSTGLTALLNRVSQKSGEYGENPVMALMDESMANGWRGIIWDRLKGEEKHERSGKGKWDEYLQDGLNV